MPIISSATALKECIEENKFQVPVTLNLFEPVKLEIGRVKLEGRELYQTGSSTQGRLRSALSEVCDGISTDVLRFISFPCAVEATSVDTSVPVISF